MRTALVWWGGDPPVLDTRTVMTRGEVRRRLRLLMVSLLVLAGPTAVDVPVAWAAPSEPPEVFAVSPNYGPREGGTEITISGQNFDGATEVSFEPLSGEGEGRAAPSFTVESDIAITAVSPEFSGEVDVVVVGPGGASEVRPADRFDYGPIVKQMTPRQGPAAGGTEVTLRGYGLEEATGVSFGSAPAESFAVNSDGSITAVAPPRPPGSTVAAVKVTTPEGISKTPSFPDVEPANWFNYGPVITSVEPSAGPTEGGTTVTLHGFGFEVPFPLCFCGPFLQSINIGPVRLDCGAPSGSAYQPCAPLEFEVVSENELRFVTPPGSGQADISVTTAGGTSPVSRVARFDYQAASIASETTIPPEGGTSDRDGFKRRKFCVARARAAFRESRRSILGRPGKPSARALRHARIRLHKRTRACKVRNPVAEDRRYPPPLQL